MIKLLHSLIKKAPEPEEQKSDINASMDTTLEEEAAKGKPERRASALAEQKRLEKKKLYKRAGFGAGGLFLIYGIYLLFKPFEGGMGFGVCKVFLENYVRYPSTITYRAVEDYNDNVRIWFSHTDAFGEYRQEALRCYYGPDTENMPGRGFVMTRATMNRRDIDPEIVSKFNISIPAIRANPPDLVYPPAIPDALSDMKFQTDLLRRKLF